MTTWPRNPTSRYTPKAVNAVSKRCLHIVVSSSTAHSKPSVEATQAPVNRGLDKQNVVQRHDGLFPAKCSLYMQWNVCFLKRKTNCSFPIISCYLHISETKQYFGLKSCIHLYETSPGLLDMWKNVSMVGGKITILYWKRRDNSCSEVGANSFLYSCEIFGVG